MELSSVKKKAITYLRGVGDEAYRRDYFNLVTRKPGQADEVVGDYEVPAEVGKRGNGFLWLDPEVVSLPADGVAGAASMLELIPDKLRKIYERPSGLILPQPRDGTKKRKPFVRV